MRLAILGTGYVGLVSGACLADFGHDVTCVDTDRSRLETLLSGRIPFFEPGLQELVSRHQASGRLHFSGDVPASVADVDVVFFAVGTPATAGGDADLSQLTAAVASVLSHVRSGCVIATKSTVPVGTGAMIRQLLARQVPRRPDIEVVSNPEFLREGSAIADFMRPDRVVIGTSSSRAAAVMREIYRPLYLIETPIVFTTVETAEMIKYASNAFLAVKISFVNEVANLCDATGADVHVVAKAMGLDKRIGSKFLHPGPGYGGSCFPKDTRALAALGNRLGIPASVVSAAIAANEHQRAVTLQKIAQAAGGLQRAVVAVLGLTFKPNTSDIRESPACLISRDLLAAGATVRAFDPAGMDEAREWFGEAGDRLHLARDAYDAVAGADLVAVLTEWNEFRGLDLQRVRSLMRRAVIVDARNVIEPDSARSAGFTYVSMGRGIAVPACEKEPAPASALGA